MVNIENDSSNSSSEKEDEENFDFILWKSELNIELLSFWKTITEEE